MKTKMHNGSRLLSLLLAVVLVFTLTVPALAAEKPPGHEPEDRRHVRPALSLAGYDRRHGGL